MAVHMPKQFAAHLRAGVRAYGKQNVVVLAPRYARVNTVDTTGAGEDELTNSALAAQLEHVMSAAHVHFLIRERISDREADASFCGEMYDHVILAIERAIERSSVS